MSKATLNKWSCNRVVGTRPLEACGYPSIRLQTTQATRDERFGTGLVQSCPRIKSPRCRSQRGFTLIELLVVMAIIATLLTLALPRYFHSLDKSREAVLRQDLSVMRDAIDKFFADRGRYPETLDELADKRYLRKIPVDPITESAATWTLLPPPETSSGTSTGTGGVYDVKSGAKSNAMDGTPFESW